MSESKSLLRNHCGSLWMIGVAVILFLLTPLVLFWYLVLHFWPKTEPCANDPPLGPIRPEDFHGWGSDEEEEEPTNE